MGNERHLALSESREGKGRFFYRVFAGSILVGICLIWAYRLKFLAEEEEQQRGRRWGWLGLFGAELWFGFYWIITQSCRWNPIHRRTFKHNLSQRHEGELPGVDIFVCTADPEMEPPAMVISTVLSVMAYDYPTEKLSVYLSDDAGSELTYYALMEASQFAKHWIPFCKKFNIQPRSPAAYFASQTDHQSKEVVFIQKLYKDMESRIKTAVDLGRVPEEIRSSSRGFSQWESSSYASRRDHDTFLQILIDGRDLEARDVEGSALPTLVYLAREKRPQYFHNFKAGAMNALLRVSSQISNGQIILNVDCDMYSNNSDAIRDALCFFMDEEKGHEIAYVQFPQKFDNVTTNEIYASTLRVISEVEFPGLNSLGGPLYIGTGCFHRRDVLCGKKFSKGYRNDWNCDKYMNSEDSVNELEEKSKHLTSCSYEENTEWGKEMGLRYGCPVEDVITGLSIQSQGWKSVYYNPKRGAFLGVAPTTLLQTLVQHKRWSEGDLQILFSRYSPARGKISLGLRMAYCIYCLWAVNSLATLYYSIIPSLYLLRGIPLFPQVSSPWLIPFTYVIFAKYAASLVEFLWAGGTILGWWNEQRIWLYKRTSSYLFALIDTVLKMLGFTDSAFVITAKVTDEEVSQRYEKEIMEFGASSPMFTILATISLVNLLCFLGMVKKAVESGRDLVMAFQTMPLQILLCGILVLINLPLYQGLFFRTDKGKMPSSLTIKSFMLAVVTCISFSFLL